MKAKQLLVLVALLGVAVIIAIAVNRSGGNSDGSGGLAAGDAVFSDLPVNAIAKIKIVGDESSVQLERAEGKWVVAERAGYPADFTKISRVLKGLRELEVAEPRRAGESVYGRFELKSPAGDPDDKTGVLVELSDGEGGDLGALVLGKRYSGATDGSGRSGGGRGRYVRDVSNSDQVFIVSESLNDIDPTPSSWLQHEFFRVVKPRDVTVTRPDGEVYAFSRSEEGGELSFAGLADDEELNAANTATLGSAFTSASFRDVVVGDAAAPAATGLDKPVAVDITTFEGFTYAVKLGRSGAPAEDDAAAPKPTYYLSFEVDVETAAEREPGEDESVADDASDEDKENAGDLKRQRDEAFATAKKDAGEKLDKEKAFVGKIYEIDSWSAEKFFMGRDELVKKKVEPAADAAPVTGAGAPIPGLPPGVSIQAIPPGGVPK